MVISIKNPKIKNETIHEMVTLACEMPPKRIIKKLIKANNPAPINRPSKMTPIPASRPLDK